MSKKGMKNFHSHSKSLYPKISSTAPPWPWCGNINTLSFRSPNPKDHNFRTFNSAFPDSELTPPDSLVSSSSRTFSTMSEDSSDPVETVIRGLRSDRLFFDPEKSSSLVAMPLKEEEEEEEVDERVAYKESEMLSIESENPYEDFRKSMEEMVEAHGLKDLEGFEELVKCYLDINGKSNHTYIMAAFIDLLVSHSFESSSSNSSPSSSSTKTIQTTSLSSSSISTNSNYSSPSSITTPCLSSILDHDNHDDHDDEHASP